MRSIGFILAMGISGALGVIAQSQGSAAGNPQETASAADAKPPVFVELFTSEGCSSCPPADNLLAKLGTQSNVIVLSEHVTYWNGQGWRDPYSSLESTTRQSDYVARLGLSSAYTPQMVVDGKYEFVGSDASAAVHAINQDSTASAVPITISDFKVDGNKHVTFAVATGTVDKGSQLFVVAAQDEGIEHVANGENGGHVLRHVQIARNIRQVANVRKNAAYQGTVTLDLPEAIAGSGWHLVVFLQQGTGGPILGASSHPV